MNRIKILLSLVILAFSNVACAHYPYHPYDGVSDTTSSVTITHRNNYRFGSSTGIRLYYGSQYDFSPHHYTSPRRHYNRHYNRRYNRYNHRRTLHPVYRVSYPSRNGTYCIVEQHSHGRVETFRAPITPQGCR